MARKTKFKKASTVAVIHNVEYSVRDLVESLRSANNEAQGYLDQLNPLRDRNKQLEKELASFYSARRVILELFGVRQAP